MSKNTLALSVIMRNEEDHVDRFLGSFDLSQFDEVVAVDTGSTDATVEKFEAWRDKIKNLRIIHAQWEGDFSKARQIGMDSCTTEYMMWADLDDVIEGTENLKQIMKDNPHIDSFIMPYNYDIAKSGEVLCRLHRERIVRRSKYTWRSPLHEVLLAHEPAAQTTINSVVYNHYPRHDEGSVVGRKIRNLKILKRALKSDPDEPRTYFYLGNAYMGFKKYDKAEHYYREYVKRSKWSEEKYLALTRIAKLCLDAGRQNEANEMLYQSMHMCPHLPMAYYLLGEMYLKQGDAKRALEFLEIGLSKPAPTLVLAENPADYTYVPKTLKFDALFALSAHEDAYKWGRGVEDEITNPDIRRGFLMKMSQAEELANRAKLHKQFANIREYLIRNDETKKAEALTKCIPYTMEYDAESKTMAIMDKLNFAPQIAENIDAVGCELPDEVVLNLHKHNAKAAWFMEWLKAHPGVKTILDIGCNWGWFDFWLEKNGYEVLGVDMNSDCIVAAKKKAAALNSKVEFVSTIPQDKKFDCVMAFDVIEHVEDDKAFVDMLMRSSDKYVLLATPNGCFSCGTVHDAKDGTTQPHLRVYTSKSLKEACAPWAIEVMHEIQDGHMLITALEKKKRPEKKIAIFCGRTPEYWGPDALIRGTGGSEEAVIHVSNRLAERGWDVTIFGHKGPNVVLDGITWLGDFELMPSDSFDVFIGWRNFAIFEYEHAFTAAKKFVWMHDVPIKGTVSQKAVNAVDGIFALSEYHKSLLPDFAKEKAIITANGIDTDAVGSIKDRENNPHKMVWTSSYLRGLEALLKNWGKIRKAVPDAELHIMYGWETTDANPPLPPDEYRLWRAHMVYMMETQDGIFHYGRLPQMKTMQKMGECGVFAYLTLFPEISCISCMKAQALGAVPFTSKTGALKETNNYGLTIDIGSDYNKFDEPIDELIGFLKNTKRQQQLRKDGVEGAPKLFSWDKVVDQWNALFL